MKRIICDTAAEARHELRRLASSSTPEAAVVYVGSEEFGRTKAAIAHPCDRPDLSHETTEPPRRRGRRTKGKDLDAILAKLCD